VFKLPSGQEIEQETLQAPDLTLLNQRIQDVLFTLSDFRKKKEDGRSRADYMECLARDLTTYYGFALFALKKEEEDKGCCVCCLLRALWACLSYL